jgi:aspartate aminotransferase-like enzyme
MGVPSTGEQETHFMMKYRLVTPGPAMVPEESLLELARPVRHHRTAENKKTIAEALAALKQVFATKNDVALITGSGTAAMEMAVGNVVKPGDTTIVLSAGKWGERWQELCKTFGANLVVVSTPYGKTPTPEMLAKALQEHPNAVAVFATLSETSTGIAMEIPALGKLVAGTKALFVVDGISGVGAAECRTDEWNIDLLAVGAQKALMLPPGLAYLAVSPKAKAVVEANPHPPTYYLNLKSYLKSLADSDTPYTPAHTLIGAQVLSLRRLLDEGMENVWARTRLLAAALTAAAKALGLELFADRPSVSLTVLKVPDGVDGPKWEKLLETKYGVKCAGGQGELKGKIVRFAHMGYVDAFDVVSMAAGLEWSLAELGRPVEFGVAVAAASRVLGDGLTK